MLKTLSTQLACGRLYYYHGRVIFNTMTIQEDLYERITLLHGRIMVILFLKKNCETNASEYK